MQVIFTQRAYVSILAETAEKIQTETGGIFLGYRDANCWYVVEAIDPGPKSTFQVAYFEYDTKYVNHLVNKIARLYSKPLELIGLWHRHPGSFDQFSGTDDGTNEKYASLHKNGAISALVNVDPEFRLTVFHVTSPLEYHRVSYEIGDQRVPEQFRTLCDTQRLLDYVSHKENSIWGTPKLRRPKYKYDAILNDIIKNLAVVDVTNELDEGQLCVLSNDEVAALIEETETDLEYFSECYMDFQMTLQNRFLKVQNQNNLAQTFQFGVVQSNNRFVFKHGNRFYLYTSGMFRCVIEDVVKMLGSMPKVLSFARSILINKEFVECSLKKLKSN